MKTLSWQEFQALDLPYVSAAVPEEKFLSAWEFLNSYAVSVATDDQIWLAMVGAPTKLDYARSLTSAANLGKPVQEVDLPTEFAEQLELSDTRSWTWMWRDDPLSALPMGCELVQPGQVDTEIERFMLLYDIRPSVMPGDSELQFWITHRDENHELDAVSAGVIWQSGACVISSVAVSPNSRRRGLGSAVTQVATSEFFHRGATRVSLGVRAGNPAINMYRSLGFNHEIALTSVKFNQH